MMPVKIDVSQIAHQPDCDSFRTAIESLFSRHRGEWHVALVSTAARSTLGVHLTGPAGYTMCAQLPGHHVEDVLRQLSVWLGQYDAESKRERPA